MSCNSYDTSSTEDTTSANLELKEDHKEGVELLYGNWERVGDEFAGMAIHIRKRGDEVIGELIRQPDGKYQTKWTIGVLKLRNINHVENNEFDCESMRINTVSGEFIDYIEMRLTLLGDSIFQTIGNIDDSEFGFNQTWKRMSNLPPKIK